MTINKFKVLLGLVMIISTGFYFNFFFPKSVQTKELVINEIPKRNLQLVEKSISKYPGWEIAFYDEFNDSVLNNTWTALERADKYNNELQTYKKENVHLADGRLFLIGKNENHTYTSGLIQTKGKQDILYGKVEVKAKYPAGKGLFPAIWLLRSDDQDALPEIDILESVGDDPEVVYMVHHWKENGVKKRIYETSIVKTFDQDHLYSLEWEPNEIRWYIDGNLVFSSNENVPDVPMYVIINLAIGGNWPGSPDESTVFPAEFSIDYVKIYRKVGGVNG
ncbi:glycoside hydrolase family 16 protein [Neobacillus niacini]|uniref:glycoside hydrolase family 16 protein n=1 Tax=Neobacillus niacini TaxID=86668 RepID=UPI002FFD8E85